MVYVTFTISTDIGNANTTIGLVISDFSAFSIENSTDIEVGGQVTNNNFIIGVDAGMSSTFIGYISLVSVYDGLLSDGDINNLWSAYAECTPKPSAYPNDGRC